jgi:iron complex outermembrane receptor protein
MRQKRLINPVRRALGWATALASGIVVSSISSAAAQAQDQTADVESEDIVVTASGYEQSLLDVPYNITAINGEELAQRGITDLYGLSRAVPGLVYADTGPRGGLAQSIVIRGLSFGAGGAVTRQTVTEPTVSTYINNTPVFANLYLSDLQRVEVLRGPQGTLYGASAEAGTIRFIFARPEFEAVEGNVRGGVSLTRHAGDVNYSVGTTMNAPLAPTLALRLSADWQENSGYITIPNLYQVDPSGVPILANPSAPVTSPGVYSRASDVNWDQTLSVRGALRWNPVPEFDATLMYQHQEQESGGPNYVGYRQYGENSFLSSSQLREPYESELDFVSLEMEGSLGFATLSSSSSYYKSDAAGRTDLTGFYMNFPFYAAVYGASPRPLFENNAYNRRSAYVQELRLTSADDGPVKWIVGGFYRKEDRSIGDKQYARGYSAFYAACRANPVVPCGLGTAFPQSPMLGAIQNELDFAYTTQAETDFREKALYGEAEWELTPGLRITGGIRGYWQNTTTTQSGGLLFLGPDAVSTNTGKTSDSGILYKAGVSYDVTPDIMLFAIHSKGQRPGGVNSLPALIDGQPVNQALFTYSADTVRNFEAGAKGRLGSLGTFSLSLFQMDWDNIQQMTSVTSLVIASVINAGDARARGVELEANLKFTPNFSATLGYSYTDVELTKASPPPGAGGVYNVGVTLPGVPDHLLSGSLKYEHQLAGDQQFIFAASGTYRGETHTALRFDQDRVTDAFFTADASVTWRTDKFDLKAYVTNLTDELGIFGYVETAASRASAAISRPRTVGLAATIRY